VLALPHHEDAAENPLEILLWSIDKRRLTRQERKESGEVRSDGNKLLNLARVSLDTDCSSRATYQVKASGFNSLRNKRLDHRQEVPRVIDGKLKSKFRIANLPGQVIDKAKGSATILELGVAAAVNVRQALKLRLHGVEERGRAGCASLGQLADNRVVKRAEECRKSDEGCELVSILFGGVIRQSWQVDRRLKSDGPVVSDGIRPRFRD
jgi:hypothetical protein